MDDFTVDDEEGQQQNLALLLSRQQEELRTMKEELEEQLQQLQQLQQEKQNHINDNANLQNQINDIQNTWKKDMADATKELRDEIAQLMARERQRKDHDQNLQHPQDPDSVPLIGNSTSPPPTAPVPDPAPTTTAATAAVVARVVPTFFQRNLVTHDGLPQDTFTLMMTSEFCSQAWSLGLFAFTFQMVLVCMIGTNQLQESINSSDFNVPFMVDPVVRAGQLFAIIFALATQSDIISSIRFFVMFYKDDHWDRILLGRMEHVDDPPTRTEWIVHILIPNVLKFLQGLLVIVATIVVIVQSDNIIELLKDFTALMVLSEIDNIFFGLAANGYLGSSLQMKSIQAREIKVNCEVSVEMDSIHGNMNHQATASRRTGTCKEYVLRPTILLIISVSMIGGWLYIVGNQVNGRYFRQRYTNCSTPEMNTFELAQQYFGDDFCYGGPLNTLECEFEGGDCINFNLEFPLCKGDNLINVQEKVGNGICDPMFMNAECDYDGGDCCDYEIINDPSFGDGICDERMNTKGCGYDNGDCINYNRVFSGCSLELVVNNPSFGDGQCDAGIQSTERCGYDNGDCNPFRLSYPNCPLIKLSQMKGASNVILGDGVCDSGIYNSQACGYEFNDCKRGQLGQTVSIADNIESNDGYIAFTKTLSLDGTTMAVGLYGNFIRDTPGLVRVWRYDNDNGKVWRQLGQDIPGDLDEDNIGSRLTLSSNGNRIAISSRSGMKVFDFKATSNQDGWTQVGSTLISTILGAHGTMTADGKQVALVHSPNEIRIYNLRTSASRGQYWVNEDYDIIHQGADLGSYIQLKFDTTDAKKLMLEVPRNVRDKSTRVFSFLGGSNLWTQLGQDIESLNVHLTSCAISAGGNRLAIPFNSTAMNAPGQVIVYDYHSSQNQWIQVGSPLISISSTNGDGFGSSIDMSSKGNILVIGSNSPICRFSDRSDLSEFTNRFDTIECPTTGSIQVFNYDHITRQFLNSAPDSSVSFRDDTKIVSNGNIFGLHTSISEDGGVLAVSGYNVDEKKAFVQAYDWAEFFFLNTNCGGLLASYFVFSSPFLPNEGLLNSGETPYATEIVDTINFFQTEGNFAGSGRADYVAGSFEGNLVFEEIGTYHLCLTSDDGSNLYMNGMLFIDNDGRHRTTEVCANFTVSDKMSEARIVVDYFEATGSATLELAWMTPSNSQRVIIPPSMWIYNGECVPVSSSKRPTPILAPTQACVEYDFFNVGPMCGQSCYTSAVNNFIQQNPWITEEGWIPNGHWNEVGGGEAVVNFGRTLPCVETVGDPCTDFSDGGLCQLCTGDCDADKDCEGELRCSQRSGGLDQLENVPGCLWGVGSEVLQSGDLDYCFMPTSEPGVVNYVGECGVEEYLCGECEGDCDSDVDCEDGLECFFRSGYETVPGCTGEGGDRDVVGRDICFKPTNNP